MFVKINNTNATLSTLNYTGYFRKWIIELLIFVMTVFTIISGTRTQTRVRGCAPPNFWRVPQTYLTEDGGLTPIIRARHAAGWCRTALPFLHQSEGGKHWPQIKVRQSIKNYKVRKFRKTSRSRKGKLNNIVDCWLNFQIFSN